MKKLLLFATVIFMTVGTVSLKAQTINSDTLQVKATSLQNNISLRADTTKTYLVMDVLDGAIIYSYTPEFKVEAYNDASLGGTLYFRFYKVGGSRYEFPYMRITKLYFSKEPKGVIIN